MHPFCPPLPLHPSPFAPSPNCHRCMPANSFFLHHSNKSADNSRDRCPLFCPGKQFKMNFYWPGLGIYFILCMSALYNGAFCILKKRKMDCRLVAMPKSSRRACGPDKGLHTIQQALAMHASQLPWLGRADSGRWGWGYRESEVSHPGNPLGLNAPPFLWRDDFYSLNRRAGCLAGYLP